MIIISAFKRLFGNSVSARKWENIVQKIKLKAVYTTGIRRCLQCSEMEPERNGDILIRASYATD